MWDVLPGEKQTTTDKTQNGKPFACQMVRKNNNKYSISNKTSEMIF